MKIILQHDDRDCGAACLAMVAWHYGYKKPLSFFRELSKTDRNGTNLYGMVEAAKKIGFLSQALNGSVEELIEEINKKQISFPFVAHILNEQGMLHFIVITGIKKGRFQIIDPGIGRKKMELREFAECWSGYILTYKKSYAFAKCNAYKNSLRNFTGMVKENYLKLFAALVLSLMISVISIYSALVFELVIDNFYEVQNAENNVIVEEEFAETESITQGEGQVHESEEVHEEEYWLDKLRIADYYNRLYDWLIGFVSVSSFHLIFILLFVFYGFHAVLQFVRGRLIAVVARNMDLGIMMNYFRHLSGLPVASIATRMTGEYLSRFSDIYIIRDAVSTATITILLDTVMMIACGVMLYFQNARLFGVTLIMLVLYAIIVLVFRKPVERSNRKAMEYSAVTESYFKETIDGMETIKAADAETYVQKRMQKKIQQFVNAVFKSDIVAISQNTLTVTVELAGTAVILWIGFTMVLKGYVTIGQMMTFYSLLAMFTDPVKNLIELQPTLQTAMVAADRLNDVLDQKGEEHTGEAMPETPISEWKFEHVNFRYGNQKLILQDININIHRGEKIAVVGESGSGKTTMAKLLMRFYLPEEGNIRLDERCITEYCLEDLRKNIAYVDQHIFLFSDTIRNNLKLGCEDVSDEEMIKVCKACHAHEFIEKLPMGYDTPLAENGTNLSGGQRQRLAIARALLKKPQLLILDEATSNLDTVTEEGIRNTIFQLDSSMTCIIIAHRLSTVKKCDCIYVLEEGKITEWGKHEELLKQNGKYAGLWNSQ